jgi:predicted NACHT family NTPase
MTPSPPSNLEKVFEALDNKFVSLGVPGALSVIGLDKLRQSSDLWKEAAAYFAAAAGVWLVIKIGKKLAPKLDNLLDWGIGNTETALVDGFAAVRSDFTRTFLRQQAQLNEEFITEGYTPDRTAIPMLEEVFVPLELSGEVGGRVSVLVKNPDYKALSEGSLSIWELSRRSRKDRAFRHMSILAKGGMGKTTLLRHIALIYGQRKQRRYRAPNLVPILLRLRYWVDELSSEKPPTLPGLISNYLVPALWLENAPTPPAQWADKLLKQGQALILLDGFDEIPPDCRRRVSHWIHRQMRQYAQSVFILTSRPAGYRDYTAQKPAIPIFVKRFNPQQQADFIRRWYLCQEKCVRSERQLRQAKAVAKERADNLITQLDARREELGYMAENPLLLNMLVTFHRFDPSAELPRQRLELYRGICELQLKDRPKARIIRMLLPYGKSYGLLQKIALGMVRAKRLALSKAALMKFLEQQPVLSQEEIAPSDWLKQIVDVSELLVEREPGEYEFPHATFQGFFAASLLAAPEDPQIIKRNAERVLQNWNEAIWRETALLYTAQINSKQLDWIIRKACQKNSEAAELAVLCLKEYPRPEKVNDDLRSLLEDLTDIAQESKYQTLENLLMEQKWREADQETYRLMITTVGKEEGQWFDAEELLNFPCEELLAIDRLWVKYSQGKWGFSVQKQIYADCGATLDGSFPGTEIWYDFCDRVGWRKDNSFLNYSDLTFDPSISPSGEFPVGGGVGWLAVVGAGLWDWGDGWVDGWLSSLASRLVNCSK